MTLEQAIDLLWGWMPAEQVAEIRRDVPELADLCVEIHHKLDHAESDIEQRRARQIGLD